MGNHLSYTTIRIDIVYKLHSKAVKITPKDIVSHFKLIIFTYVCIFPQSLTMHLQRKWKFLPCFLFLGVFLPVSGMLNSLHKKESESDELKIYWLLFLLVSVHICDDNLYWFQVKHYICC